MDYGRVIENFIYDKIDNQFECMQFMNTLSEAQTLNVSDKLISALYKSVLEKYNFIDFGDIPNCKGDITRMKRYDDIKETISLLNQLKEKAGIIKLDELVAIETSLSILEHNKTDFCAGFLQNKQIIIVLFDTITLSIISGLNFIIGTMVEYISTPQGGFDVILTNHKKQKTMDNLLIKNLRDFNSFAQKGELKKLFNTALNKQGFIGVALAGTAVVIATSIILVNIIRELIFYMYNIRMSVSEYLDAQAKFLELNAMVLKSNKDMRTVQTKKSVIAKQEKTAKKLRTIADKIKLKFESSDVNTKKDLNNKTSLDNVKTSMTSVDNDLGFTLM